MNITREQRDLLRDVLQAKREELNRAAEGLLYDIEALDAVLLQLQPMLCPNCGEEGWHEAPEECRR